MAFETSQKYKEGKFIIEKARLLKVGNYCTCLSVCEVWTLLQDSMTPTSLLHAMAALACQATATDVFDLAFVWADFMCGHSNTHDAYHIPLSHL